MKTLDQTALIAKAIEQFVAGQSRKMFTIGLVVIKTLHRDPETGLVIKVDVVPKWDPLGGLLTKCPVIHLRGNAGLIVSPMAEEDICLALFSQFPLQDLILDEQQRQPHSQRHHSMADCMVFPGGMFVDTEVVAGLGIPDGYTNKDLLIMQKDSRGIWMKDNDDIILGKLDASGGDLKKVLVDGNSNAAGGVGASGDTKVYIGRG